VYQFSEREQEAENAFNRVLTLYQDQLEDHSDTSLLGRTLDALNELYRMQGRNEELEKSLLLRQRMIGQGGDEPAGF